MNGIDLARSTCVFKEEKSRIDSTRKKAEASKIIQKISSEIDSNLSQYGMWLLPVLKRLAGTCGEGGQLDSSRAREDREQDCTGLVASFRRPATSCATWITCRNWVAPAPPLPLLAPCPSPALPSANAVRIEQEGISIASETKYKESHHVVTKASVRRKASPQGSVRSRQGA